ncbi:MAG TPA: hypothetical protein VGH97_04450 [Thermoanaerobaculia bacterium]
MNQKRRIALVLGTVVLAAGVSAAARAADLAKASGGGVTTTSRPVRLLRTWQETVKVNGRDYPRTMRLVFDYAKGEAREESYDAHGILRVSRRYTQTLPVPSKEELAEAYDIVRGEPALASIFARFGVVLEGGFPYEESVGMPCGPGARCVHVLLLSADRAGLIRRVVVDLGSRTVPYLVYTPPVSESHR